MTLRMEFLFALILFVLFMLLLDSLKERKVDYKTSDEVIEEMWVDGSSPSDRRAILEGLSAVDCLDAGLCELAIDLPVAAQPDELRDEPWPLETGNP